MVYLTMFWNVQSVQIKNSTFGLKKKKKKCMDFTNPTFLNKEMQKNTQSNT